MDYNSVIIHVVNPGARFITALHHSIKQGDTAAVKALVVTTTIEQRSKLLLVRDSSNKTALQDAESTEMAEALLVNLPPEQRLQFLSQQDKDGNRVIHIAAQQREKDVMQSFLDGLAPDRQLKLLSMCNKKGQTPLDCAAERPETVDIMEKYKQAASRQVKIGVWVYQIGGFSIMFMNAHL